MADVVDIDGWKISESTIIGPEFLNVIISWHNCTGKRPPKCLTYNPKDPPKRYIKVCPICKEAMPKSVRTAIAARLLAVKLK